LSTVEDLLPPSPDRWVLTGTGWQTSPSFKYTLQLSDFGSRVNL